MISVDKFFSSTLATVDAVINNFVSTAYSHLIGQNSEVITLIFTFYIMMLGYRFLAHGANVNSLIRHIIVMLCVYGMIMSWHLYNVLVYNIFTNEPSNIAQVLVNAAGKYSSSISVSSALDEIYKAVIDSTMELFSQVNFSATGLAFIFYGGLVFAIGSVMCVIALLLFIYSKMMMSISLALGPIFILFILWEPTKGMFAAWLRKLFTLALIPIVTSAVLALMLSVIDITLPSITQTSEHLHFQGIAPFLGLSLATALVLSQVLHVCSALGGGISLASISQGVEIARSSLEKSGITNASRRARALVRNKINPPTKKFRKT
ncbi:MAG: TrbL/VirB6 family protein [Gammaproteobacteria bacterium]